VFAALAASAASAALVVKEDGAKENIFLLFLTALPLGIGIILGGILLILLLIKRKQT